MSNILLKFGKLSQNLQFKIGDLDWISNPIFTLGFGLDFKFKCSGFLKGLHISQIIQHESITYSTNGKT